MAGWQPMKNWKSAIYTESVLVMSNFNNPLEVGIVAVLCQLKHPMAFFSRPWAIGLRANQPVNGNWFWQFNVHYLLGRKFEDITDHNSLKNCMNQKVITPVQQHENCGPPAESQLQVLNGFVDKFRWGTLLWTGLRRKTNIMRMSKTEEANLRLKRYKLMGTGGGPHYQNHVSVLPDSPLMSDILQQFHGNWEVGLLKELTKN